MFSFEVGQFEVLPDFDELAHFKGISDPAIDVFSVWFAKGD